MEALRNLFPAALRELEPEHDGGEQQRDAVGGDDGQAADGDAIDQPQRDAGGEQRIHRRGNAGQVARAPGVPGLRHEGDGGEESGRVADQRAEFGH